MNFTKSFRFFGKPSFFSLYTGLWLWCFIYVFLLLLLSLSRVPLFETPWTIACQAPLSMRIPRQESWSELPFPPLGDLPDPGMERPSPALAGWFFATEPHAKPSSVYLHSSLRCIQLFCDPVDWGLPGSSVHGTLQARRLEWAAIPCPRGSSWPGERTRVSCLQVDSLPSVAAGVRCEVHNT